MVMVRYGLFEALCLLPLLLFAAWWTRDRRPRTAWLALFLALTMLDAIAVLLPPELHLNPPAAHWNWVGKALSLTWAVLFLWIGPLRARETGLTAPRRNARAAGWTVVVVAIGACALGDWLTGPLRPTAETLLYQLTMPALAEELVFRGILFTILSRAFREDAYPPRHYLGWSVWITATAFGLSHAIQIAGGHVDFQWLAFLFPFAFGVLAGWLRRYSGSLWMPVVMHGGIDFAAAAVAFF